MSISLHKDLHQIVSKGFERKKRKCLISLQHLIEANVADTFSFLNTLKIESNPFFQNQHSKFTYVVDMYNAFRR